MGDRCTGHCCEIFNLPYSVNQIRRMSKQRGDEFDTIAEMLLTITAVDGGLSDINAFAASSFYLPAREPTIFYTCRHFNDVQRICEIYEKRPNMCRVYPNNGPGSCVHRGCTWTDAARPYYRFYNKNGPLVLRVLQTEETQPCVNEEYENLRKRSQQLRAEARSTT